MSSNMFFDKYDTFFAFIAAEHIFSGCFRCKEKKWKQRYFKYLEWSTSTFS